MDPRKRKLWLFGCSFTHGSGCTVGDKYYESSNHRSKLWGEYLGESLGYELINKGIPSASNEMILREISINLPKIKKDDIVIIGSTISSRFTIINDYKGVTPSVQGCIFFDGNDIKKYQNEHRILIDYQYEFRTKLESEWEKYYSSWFDGTIELIENTLDVPVIYWDDRLWRNFNSITYDTRNRIPDDHWSWTGHYQMYIHMLETIERKYPEIKRELTLELKYDIDKLI